VGKEQMAGYKEYKSVKEFPLHIEGLNREQLEESYKELRESYRSLTISRGQLVRRQTESKQNLADVSDKLKRSEISLETIQQEKQRLQKALQQSVSIRNQLESKGNSLASEVDELTEQLQATARLLGDFETAYEDVQAKSGVFTIWQRFSKLLAAANRLLNTDIETMLPKPRKTEEPDDWTKETPANINRSLLDDQ
jgi:chromosome segregation ATPase